MDEIVSIIGGSYFEPLSMLIENIEEYENESVTSVRAGNRENGFSASICLLSVVCLESYVMRSRYVDDDTSEELIRSPVTKYIKNKYNDYPYFNETNEVFVVRDLLAHNHLIKISFTRENDGSMNRTGSTRISTGDKKFSANVKNNTEKTQILDINTNPVSVGYNDAMTVLRMVWSNLIFLENRNRNQCYVSHLRVKHKGKLVRFGEVIGMPETCT